MRTVNDLKPGDIAYFNNDMNDRENWCILHYAVPIEGGRFKGNGEYMRAISGLGSQWNHCLTPEQYHAMLNKPKDKQPVYARGNEDTHCKCLRFYDSINDRTFSVIGKRGGMSFDNYEPIPNHLIPSWMLEAQKTLED